jgi:phosphatidylglycerophosphate synthase
MWSARRYNVPFAIGLAATIGAASIVGSWAGCLPYVLKASAFFAGLFVAIVSIAGAEHPYPRFGPANGVTTTRAGLTALVAGAIGHAFSVEVLWFIIALTTVIGILDGVDGWVARRTGMASAYGARFDMETDAALILVLSILVWQHEKAGAWVLLCGLMRYLFVAAGRALPWLAAPLSPTRRGRTVAVGQLAGLGVALAPATHVPASGVVAAMTLAALVWSFAIDVMWLRHHGQGNARRRPHG